MWQQPLFQDVVLWPVVFRRVRATMAPAAALEAGSSAGKATQYELLVSATAVEALVVSLGYESVDVLFRDAVGVLVDETLMEVESATVERDQREAYLCRVVVRAPLALTD